MTRKPMSSGKKMALMVVIPLIAVIIATIALSFSGYEGLATWVSFGGAVLVVLVALLYIVLVDSKSIWPELPASQRLAKVLTLSR